MAADENDREASPTAPRTAPVDPLAGVAGGVVAIDHDGVVRARNDEAELLLGAPASGANLWAALSDQVVCALRAVVDEAVRSGERRVGAAPVQCVGAWCRVVVTPTPDGVVIHVLDVADQIRAEERVRALEAEAQRRDRDLHGLLAAWGMRVSYVDRDLRFTTVYNAPSTLHPSLYLGKRAYEFADDAAGHELADFQLEVLTSGRSLRREISFHDHHRLRTWLLYGEPILEADGVAGVKTVALDVSGLREAEAAATKDFLTGVLNRRAMEELVHQESSRSTRYGTAASVIVLDIDRFKDVNDTFGHPVGDAVLRAVVERLAEELRDADVIARWGGEEFLVLLPETCEDEANRVAERMRARVADEPFATVGTVTISLGVATTVPGEAADVVVARADAACLLAKRHGRDRVEVAGAEGALDESGAWARPLFPPMMGHDHEKSTLA
jgi:diguanylate cyclase (GGDEF)-like protein